jgi:hypothetical protein
MIVKEVVIKNFCLNVIGLYLPSLSGTVIEADNREIVHMYGHEIWLTIEQAYGKKIVIEVWLQLYQNRAYVQHVKKDQKSLLIKDLGTKKLLK